MLEVFARGKFAALQMSTRFWAHWDGSQPVFHLEWCLFMSPATRSVRVKIS